MMKVNQKVDAADVTPAKSSDASQGTPTSPEDVSKQDRDAFIARFKALDTNKSGVLEEDEYNKSAVSKFKSFDEARQLVTKDQYLTQSDFVVARAQREHAKDRAADAPQARQAPAATTTTKASTDAAGAAPAKTPAKTQTNSKSTLQSEGMSSEIAAAPGSVEAKRAANKEIGAVEAKSIIRDAIDKSWDAIQPIFNFKSKEQAYALFFGDASRESAGNRPSDGKLTFMMDLETAVTDPKMPLEKSNPARAYGPFQAAVTGFENNNPRFNKEPLAGFPQAKLTPENYYDAEVSTLMGIRKIAFYAQDAKSKGLVGQNASAEEIFQYGIAGHNTGYANAAKVPEWQKSYGNEVTAMAEWYAKGNHLYDDQIAYTGDPRTRQYLP